MILEIGAQIGDYRVLSRIGRGTYGVVFEAEHALTQRVDALKVMLDGALSPESEERFLREIQAHASLQHPSIATVYQAFRSPYGLVLAMERVYGESLRSLISRHRLSIEEGLRYVTDTLTALDYAESRGVIHRDLKPENILITPSGDVKLTDFGLAHVMYSARITGTGESLGTPSYMSPEQIDGLGQVDERTDVYSMGVMLYEIASGRVPFPGGNGFAVMLAHRDTRPAPPATIEPSIEPWLNDVILKALEKDPDKRFPNSRAFRDALRPVVASVRVPVSPSRSQMRPISVAVTGLVLSAATMAGGYRAFRHPTAPEVQAKKAPEPAMPTTREVDVVEPPAPQPVTMAPAAVLPAAVVSEPHSSAPPTLGAVPPQIHRHEAVRKRPIAQVAAKESVATSLAAPAPAMEVVASPRPPEPQPAPPPEPAAHAAPPATPPPAEPGPAERVTTPADQPEATAEPKKHNAVVRAFGHLFHKKPATPKPDQD